MRKPISSYGAVAPEDERTRLHKLWEGSFLFWPDQALLITSRQGRPGGGKDEQLRGLDLRCPMQMMFRANYGLVTAPFYEVEDFFDPYHWPRTFEVIKNRFDGNIGAKSKMSLLDFRLLLIG